MLGLKIFVRVQTFQRRSFVPSHHFCNPAITKYYKVASAHLESKNVLFWACARLFVATELVWLQMQGNIPRLLWGVWDARQFYSIKSVRRDLEILLRCINDENMVYGIIYGFQKNSDIKKTQPSRSQVFNSNILTLHNRGSVQIELINQVAGPPLSALGSNLTLKSKVSASLTSWVSDKTT